MNFGGTQMFSPQDSLHSNWKYTRLPEIASKIKKPGRLYVKTLMMLEGIFSIFNEFKVYYFCNWKKFSKYGLKEMEYCELYHP